MASANQRLAYAEMVDLLNNACLEEADMEARVVVVV
jgi:hypothetical protein